MKTNDYVQRAQLPNVRFAGTDLHVMPANLVTTDERTFFLEILDWVDQSCFSEDVQWDGGPVDHRFETTLPHSMAEEVLAAAESWCLGEGISLYGGFIANGSWMLSVVQSTAADFRPHFGKRRLAPRQLQFELVAA